MEHRTNIDVYRLAKYYVTINSTFTPTNALHLFLMLFVIVAVLLMVAVAQLFYCDWLPLSRNIQHILLLQHLDVRLQKILKLRTLKFHRQRGDMIGTSNTGWDYDNMVTPNIPVCQVRF